jgi:predicted nucleotidyltransferase
MSTSLQLLLEDLISWAQAQPEILAVYLYGSCAEGRASTLSDIDIAVLAGEDLSRAQLWQLEDRLAGQWPEVVDLRLLNLAPLPFRYEVTVRGRRLWAADLGKVAGLESRIWRTYWDLHPHLERDWEQHVEHAMEKQNEAERAEYQAALAEVRAVHRRVRGQGPGGPGASATRKPR